MDNFPDFEFEGFGGGKTFNFIPTHDISEIPYYLDSKLIDAVTLKSGKSWYTGKALPRTLRLIEKRNDDDTYSYTITGKMVGDDDIIVPLFDDIARREHILDITDNKNNRRLIGTNDYGMSFTWDHDTMEETSARNEFSFTFSIKMAKVAPVYNPS